jgi:hypothetical protein
LSAAAYDKVEAEEVASLPQMKGVWFLFSIHLQNKNAGGGGGSGGGIMP